MPSLEVEDGGRRGVLLVASRKVLPSPPLPNEQTDDAQLANEFAASLHLLLKVRPSLNIDAAKVQLQGHHLLMGTSVFVCVCVC